MKYGCFIGLLYIFLTSLASHGEISITNISGYSEMDRRSQTLKVFGGIAGSDSSCSGTGTCNNCESRAKACNTVRIYDNTELSLDVTSNSTTGTILVRYEDNSDTLVATSNTIPTGTTASLTVRWKKICDSVTRSSAGCDSSGNVTLTIGTDGNNDGDLKDDEDDTTAIQFFVTKPEDPVTIDTVGDCNDDRTTNGICHFETFPGDEKVFVDNLKFGEPNFNNSGQVEFNRLRVYISTVDFASALPGLTDISPRDLDFRSANENSSEFDISDRTVGGLKNDVTYFFRLAVVDQANNIAYFTNEGHIIGTTVNGSYVCDADSGNFDADACPYAAIPREVLGLLPKDLNCFIATAAYESQLAPKVKTFRQFRNRFLLPYAAGRKFVRAYYKYSPPMAQWIASNKVFQPISRFLLWPAWLFAAISLKLGLGVTTLISLFMVFGFLTLMFMWVLPSPKPRFFKKESRYGK